MIGAAECVQRGALTSSLSSARLESTRRCTEETTRGSMGVGGDAQPAAAAAMEGVDEEDAQPLQPVGVDAGQRDALWRDDGAHEAEGGGRATVD